MQALLAAAVLVAAVADPPADRGGRVKAVLQEFEATQDRLRAAFSAATDPAERTKVDDQFTAAIKATADKLLAFAREKPDDVPAFTALTFVLVNGDPAPAAELLGKHHLGRPQLARLLPEASDNPSPAVTAFLRLVYDKSPLADVRAAAGMSLVEHLAGIGDRGDRAAAAEAEAVLARVAKEYGDQPWDGGTVKDAAGPALKVLGSLSVGKPAPDLATRGLDDAPVKLTDLRGKVVVLDFWNTGCGPCRAMIPHQRELVKKLAGKPFALVSVSVDNTRDDVTAFLRKEPMPWTHWFEGPAGANLDRWNIHSFPTIYVLDATGTIRYKGVRGKAMDEAIETLLKETGAAK